MSVRFAFARTHDTNLYYVHTAVGRGDPAPRRTVTQSGRCPSPSGVSRLGPPDERVLGRRRARARDDGDGGAGRLGVGARRQRARDRRDEEEATHSILSAAIRACKGGSTDAGAPARSAAAFSGPDCCACFCSTIRTMNVSAVTSGAASGRVRAVFASC